MTAGGYHKSLALDAIVTVARAIADSEGLDAVSMRVLADRLGCTPRALYRHVSDKDEVLELLADGAMGEVALPDPEVPWQRALTDFFTGMYDLLVSSAAIAEIIARQAVAGRQFRTRADHLVALLLDEGFAPDVAVEAVVALAQFTLGAALPGTSQQLHHMYRTRDLDGDQESLPALAHVRQHFGQADARGRFRTALHRLVHAYE